MSDSTIYLKQLPQISYTVVCAPFLLSNLEQRFPSASDTSREVDVFWHEGDTFPMNAAEQSVFKQS